MAVSDTITQQQQFATDALANAETFLSKLAELATSNFFLVSNVPPIPSPGYGFDTTDETQQLLLNLFPADISVDDISATAPTFTPDAIGTLPEVPVADFTKVAPAVEIPTAPSSALPSAPTPPSIGDPVLPSAPVVPLPTPPVVGTITRIEPPSIELPEMSIALPTDDLVTPTNTFEFNEVAYQSALLDAVTAKLLDNIQNGGYGIETADESALFDRARTREIEAQQAESDALIAEAAARGFPIPPGDLIIALQRSQQNLANRLSGVNRDIVLRRSELYVDNRKFTIEQARHLEQVLIGHHNAVMERALNVQKASLDAAVKIYETQAKRLELQLDRYKADAAVFEARVRAAGVQVDVYRTQMEGSKVEADIQRVQVEVYNAQVRGVQLVQELYKTQMEAAQVQANIEGLRIQAFRALIDAYVAQVQAKQAEFGMFESRIKGEVAKVQAYESEVRAYVATVEGAKAKADIAIARLKAELERSGQNIDVFKARQEEFRNIIAAQAQVIEARTRVYGSQVQGASAKAQAVAEAHRVTVTEKDLEFRRNVENAKLALEDAKLLLQGLVASADSRTRAGESAGRYYAALVGAAVNSINTLTAQIATD